MTRSSSAIKPYGGAKSPGLRACECAATPRRVSLLCRRRVASLACAVVALLVPVSGLAGGESFNLAGGGCAAGIVLDRDAEPTSRLAAEELVEYVFKASGVRPEIGLSADGSCVRIGTLAHFPGDVPQEAKTALDRCHQFEAAWTGVKDGTLYFVGKEAMGETYAVYRFLERHLGVRWFKAATPEDPGEYVPPKRDAIAIPAFAECRQPDFEQRMLIETCSRQGSPATNGMNCVTRNGWQALPGLWPYSARPGAFDECRRYHDARLNPRLRNNGGGHGLFSAAIPKSEFESHPEYFALVKGRRVNGHMYCMSNPEVRQRVADMLIRNNRECGGWGFGILELADYMTGNCECDKCAALDGDGGAKDGRSHRFFKVMNDIKRRVRRVQPNMRFMSYAYQNYRTMPEGVEIDPDDLILYCTHGRSMVNAIDDPKAPENVRQFNEAKMWRSKVNRVGMREYMTCSHINYRPVERLLAKDLAIYRDARLCGLWEEMVYPDSPLVGAYRNNLDVKERLASNWQYFYVGGHMLWDAGLDVGALLDDAEAKYYGAAYPAMKRYHAIRRSVWDASRASFGYPFPDARTPTLMGVGDTADRLFACLDEAARLAGDDKVVAGRIAFDRHCLETYWVKPYEEMKAFAGKELRAPLKTDDGWNAAFYADDFEEIVRGTPAKGRKIPPEFETRVGFMCDEGHVYLRLIAKEPQPGLMTMTRAKDGPVWNDDGFEIFLFPPSVENTYAHIAVNALGTVYDSRCPGNDASMDYGVTAKGMIGKDRYTIDVIVPTEHLMPVRPGDVWRVCVARRRMVPDAQTEGEGGRVWSLYCVPKHDTSKMLSLEMGTANCIVNGSFEEARKGWGDVDRVEVENGMALHLAAGKVVTSYFRGELRQRPEPRRFRYSFRAKGNGTLSVVRAAITDTTDYRAKHNYTRVQHPSVGLVECNLTDKWQLFSGTGETRPDAQNGIRFICRNASDALIDDVSVVPEK